MEKARFLVLPVFFAREVQTRSITVLSFLSLLHADPVQMARNPHFAPEVSQEVSRRCPRGGVLEEVPGVPCLPCPTLVHLLHPGTPLLLLYLPCRYTCSVLAAVSGQGSPGLRGLF